MKVAEVTVSRGITVSVGKFESIRVDATIKLTAGAGEDEDVLFQTGFDVVDAQINQQVEELQDVVSNESVFKLVKEETKKETKKKSSRRRRS